MVLKIVGNCMITTDAYLISGAGGHLADAQFLADAELIRGSGRTSRTLNLTDSNRSKYLGIRRNGMSTLVYLHLRPCAGHCDADAPVSDAWRPDPAPGLDLPRRAARHRVPALPSGSGGARKGQRSMNSRD